MSRKVITWRERLSQSFLLKQGSFRRQEETPPSMCETATPASSIVRRGKHRKEEKAVLRVAKRIGSAALKADAACSVTCAYMSLTLFAGLLVNDVKSESGTILVIRTHQQIASEIIICFRRVLSELRTQKS